MATSTIIKYDILKFSENKLNNLVVKSFPTFYNLMTNFKDNWSLHYEFKNKHEIELIIIIKSENLNDKKKIKIKNMWENYIKSKKQTPKAIVCVKYTQHCN